MRSMTGCGRGCLADNGMQITVELKSVNHRYLDLNCRLPYSISFLEDTVRAEISKKLARGHVEIFLNFRKTTGSAVSLSVDPQMALAYASAAQQLSEATGIANDLSITQLMKMDGVMIASDAEIDQEAACKLCAQVMQTALQQLCDMRDREGLKLKDDLGTHLDAVAAIRETILAQAPCVVEDYHKRLVARLAMLHTDGIDEARIAQEVALMADKCAIDEELSRLESHISQMRTYLASNESKGIGKQMDFLIQEMNREANTIGSKANDAKIAQQVVLMKNEIEKLREQVQNVQ